MQTGEVALALPYKPVHIQRLNEIKRHRWNPVEKCCLFSRSENIIKRLFDVFKGKAIVSISKINFGYNTVLNLYLWLTEVINELGEFGRLELGKNLRS